MSTDGASAAAEAHRQHCEEEEQLTPYSQKDLAEDWEFKILRSATNGFKKPENLRMILDEEARAGWVLVEKFDNGRIRLKRPAAARENDRSLGFDPYRTYTGATPERMALIIVPIIIAVVAAIGTMIAIFDK